MGKTAGAAILYAEGGFSTAGEKLMGMQAANSGFLRGLARTEPPDGSLWCLVPGEAEARSFAQAAHGHGWRGPVRWVRTQDPKALAEVGCLYIPDPNLAEMAWRRLPHGERSWSLCGITHTTATHGVMTMVAQMLAAPVMPWDALICTSTVVRDSMAALLDQQADWLRWRLGAQRITLPQLPVLPLGVHCDDFVFGEDERGQSRADLGMGQDDKAVLFLGRLSFHAKAHPQPMLLALERCARAEARVIHLVLCGWFASEFIERAWREAAATLAPSVRLHVLDGRKPELRRQAWAAADVFCSLSDNIQETFGLAPVEAMAAGLPVVVSDWDGYRDTVRDGVDGFRLPTLMPEPPAGEDLARRYELGLDNYDQYCGQACELVAVDTGAAEAAFARLFADPALRRRMGEAGRARARAEYDWPVVLDRYRALWAELAELRGGHRDPAPEPPPFRSRPDRPDPFALFASYPTRSLAEDMRLALVPGASATVLAERRKLGVNAFAEAVYPSAAECEAALALAAAGPVTVARLLAAVPSARRDAVRRGLVWMVKMDVLRPV